MKDFFLLNVHESCSMATTLMLGMFSSISFVLRGSILSSSFFFVFDVKKIRTCLNVVTARPQCIETHLSFEMVIVVGDTELESLRIFS